jgi:hypothetical protein
MALINIDTTGVYPYHQEAFEMKVYPNPNSGSFMLSINCAKANKVQVALLNILGQEVFRESFDVNGRFNKMLTPENLPQGMYILRVSNGEGSQVRRITVRK